MSDYHLPRDCRLPIGDHCAMQERFDRFFRNKHRLPNPSEYEVIFTGEYNELAMCARYGIPTIVDYNSLTDVQEITYDHAIDYLSEYQRAQQTEELRKDLKQRLNAIFGAYLFDDQGNTTYTVIQKVIFNDPATIVFWTDGTKTVVKCANEKFDPEKGLVMAIAKKALGNEGNYYNQLKKWLPEEEKCPTVTVPGFQEALERVKNIGDHIKDAIDTIDTMLGDEEE